MKKNIFIIAALAILASACHESIEERAAREASDYTKKNCPTRITEDIVNDSMTFDKQTRTVSYHYTLSGKADTTLVNKQEVKDALLQGIINATNLRAYKEAGIRFQYIYRSAKNKNQELLNVTYGEKDYNK